MSDDGLSDLRKINWKKWVRANLLSQLPYQVIILKGLVTVNWYQDVVVMN